MARSKLEIQKQILEDLNKRVEKLVDQILNEAEISKTIVDPSSMAAINTIIDRIEGMTFDGNVELLRDTVSVYENAIKAIDEQLESEEMKGFDKFSEDSLKDAKKLLKEQSKNGRVGTIFDKLEEISKAEKSGDIEQRYNDDKISELDFSVKEQKEEEERRLEPFNIIISETRKSREELSKMDSIVNEVNSLVKQREDLLKEIASPDIEEEDKKAKEDEVKEITEKIREVSSKAKVDEKDKSFEIVKGEKAEDYIKRIQAQLSVKVRGIETKLLADLTRIKDLEVDLGTDKKKVEEYLKDCMLDTKKLHDLTNKLSVDKMMLRKNIEKDPKHKEMEELEARKRVYEQRNKELEDNREFVGRFEEEPKEMIEYSGKFDWRHPFKSLKSLIARGKEKRNSDTNKEITAVDKTVLKEIEKSVKGMGKGLRDKYKVEEKDRISAEVETNLNTRREKFYADLEKQEKEESR